jgi:MFS family permease
MLRHFLVIRSIDELNAQMLSVAIAWYVYAATHNPMSLAYAGLARFLPNIGMMLVTGQAADRFDRRWIIGLSTGLQAICAWTFGILLAASSLSAGIVYLLLFVIGAAQTFSAPAMSATLPNLVSGTEFPRAVTVASSAFQICSLAGPAIGGLIYGLNGPGMFVLCAALYLIALTQLPYLADHGHKTRVQETGTTDEGALAGIRYVWSNRLLLALISLDLFAVLLGGVTALLPIYAKDILLVGPAGLGFLRCAPGIGAAMVGLFLAHRTIERRAGKLMLVCVAGFGLAIFVFALSINLWLSLAALICAGGFDMVSMVIRQTLVQVSTPDAMRGRVSAVQWLFIGASSELGEFESGATAALLGTVHAALVGGLGTLAVVALWAKIFPELRWADKLAMGDEGAGGSG